MLDYISNLITAKENDHIIRMSKEEEVKKAIFELNGNSVVGPNGFTGLFFQ